MLEDLTSYIRPSEKFKNLKYIDEIEDSNESENEYHIINLIDDKNEQNSNFNIRN